MLSNGRSRLDACSEGGASGFLPRKTMVSDGCASKFPWCKFLFSANVLWYSKTIDLAALRWLSSRGMDKSEIKKALWNFMLIVYFFCQVMFFFAKEGIKRSHRPYNCPCWHFINKMSTIFSSSALGSWIGLPYFRE